MRVSPFHVISSTRNGWQALQQEVTYASYLNINTVILPVPRNRAHVASYARAVNACLEASSYTQLSIRLPIYDPLLLSITDSTSGLTLTPSPSHLQLTPSSAPSQDDVPAAAPKVPKILEPSEDELLSSTWEIWDAIRSICDYSPRLSLSGSSKSCDSRHKVLTCPFGQRSTLRPHCPRPRTF